MPSVRVNLPAHAGGCTHGRGTTQPWCARACVNRRVRFADRRAAGVGEGGRNPRAQRLQQSWRHHAHDAPSPTGLPARSRRAPPRRQRQPAALRAHARHDQVCGRPQRGRRSRSATETATWTEICDPGGRLAGNVRPVRQPSAAMRDPIGRLCGHRGHHDVCRQQLSMHRAVGFPREPAPSGRRPRRGPQDSSGTRAKVSP